MPAVWKAQIQTAPETPPAPAGTAGKKHLPLRTPCTSNARPLRTHIAPGDASPALALWEGWGVSCVRRRMRVEPAVKDRGRRERAEGLS